MWVSRVLLLGADKLCLGTMLSLEHLKACAASVMLCFDRLKMASITRVPSWAKTHWCFISKMVLHITVQA